MSTFKSTERNIAAPRALVYNKLKDPEGFKGLTANAPDSAKQQVGKIRIDGDTITIEAKPVGDVSFRIGKGVENERIHLDTVSSPLPLGINVCLADGDAADTTRAHIEIAIDLNPILKSMISKPLQEASEKLADLISFIPYNQL